MSALDSFEGYIRRMVLDGFTLQEVRNDLCHHFGDQRGFSVRSISNFCCSKGIHRFDFPLIDRLDLDQIISDATSCLGPAYGRKMFTGYLRSVGLRVGERLASSVMKTNVPIYVAERRSGNVRNVNPVPYYAEYAGHKMHMDQNEKMKDFGVTHVMAVDGFSKKIIGLACMPVKNNLIIYDEVYRETCLKYGLFDTLRVDHGKEFYLCLFQQDNLREYRTCVNRAPYIQSSSKQNHAVERMWVELNCRVNYPMKRVLLMMIENGDLDMEDQVVKFCVSQLCIQLAEIGCQNLVESWNNHTIPGKGIPNVMFDINLNTRRVPHNFLPPAVTVSAEYTSYGGKLTQWPSFGEDPLHYSHQEVQHRDRLFREEYPSLNEILAQLVNRNEVPFRNAILHLLDITNRLSEN